MRRKFFGYQIQIFFISKIHSLLNKASELVTIAADNVESEKLKILKIHVTYCTTYFLN